MPRVMAPSDRVRVLTRVGGADSRDAPHCGPEGPRFDNGHRTCGVPIIGATYRPCAAALLGWHQSSTTWCEHWSPVRGMETVTILVAGRDEGQAGGVTAGASPRRSIKLMVGVRGCDATTCCASAPPPADTISASAVQAIGIRRLRVRSMRAPSFGPAVPVTRSSSVACAGRRRRRMLKRNEYFYSPGSVIHRHGRASRPRRARLTRGRAGRSSPACGSHATL